MKTLASFASTFGMPTLGFALGSLILAYPPIIWLIQTWFDPSYQTSGLVYLPFILAVIAWSVTSPIQSTQHRAPHRAVILLIVAALLRLASQVTAINMIGGIALTLDVYAILTLSRLPDRARPVSPFWVSVLFLFTLPFERILQRVLGYPMQEVSAFGACQLLGVFFGDLVCQGVRIRVAGQDVLVDLPCSGTVSLMLALAVLTTLHTLYHPSLRQAVLWTGVTLGLSLLGNTVRITLLAVGLVYGPAFGIDVMAEPLHDVIGYITIASSLAPVLWLYRPLEHKKGKEPSFQPVFMAWERSPVSLSVMAVCFVILALIITFLPRQALDVSRVIADAPLPLVLNGRPKVSVELDPFEQRYFEDYGGTAQKALYGEMALTVVQTSSPLRHLHDPEDCLRGLGYHVRFLGTRFEPVPTSLYRATGPDGDVWHVAVTFQSNTGFSTSNVAEAIWHWLKHPGTEWVSIQRITPWVLHEDVRQTYEAATVAALDLPIHP